MIISLAAMIIRRFTTSLCGDFDENIDKKSVREEKCFALFVPEIFKFLKFANY